MPKNYRIVKIGIGAGNKDFDHANILRAMIIEEEEEEKTDSLELLETNLDDCTGEVLGYTMNLLLKAGANDVWYTPIYMKKNRPAVMVRVLIPEPLVERAEEVLFRETTTLGIRRYPVGRTVLERESGTIATPWGDCRIKRGYYKGELIRQAPEYEDVKAIALRCRKPFLELYQAIQKLADSKHSD